MSQGILFKSNNIHNSHMLCLISQSELSVEIFPDHIIFLEKQDPHRKQF